MLRRTVAAAAADAAAALSSANGSAASRRFRVDTDRYRSSRKSAAGVHARDSHGHRGRTLARPPAQPPPSPTSPFPVCPARQNIMVRARRNDRSSYPALGAHKQNVPPKGPCVLYRQRNTDPSGATAAAADGYISETSAATGGSAAVERDRCGYENNPVAIVIFITRRQSACTTIVCVAAVHKHAFAAAADFRCDFLRYHHRHRRHRRRRRRRRRHNRHRRYNYYFYCYY